MKRYILLTNLMGYKIKDFNAKKLYRIARLITDYGSNADWLQRNIKKGSQEGVVGGSMEVIIETDLAHIQPIFCDNAEDYRVTLPADTLRFIVDRWQELIPLKPDSITISEENGQYSICAEFNVSIEASNQQGSNKAP